MPNVQVRFYGPNGDNGFLSNYFEYSFCLGGREWRTVEHYYQAQKFAGTKLEEQVRQKKTPGGARSFAHARKAFWRPDWEAVKDEVMRKAVRAKFTSSAFLVEALLATGDATLIEDSPTDSYWGIGSDGQGLNKLGWLLMEVRAALCREQSVERDDRSGSHGPPSLLHRHSDY